MSHCATHVETYCTAFSTANHTTFFSTDILPFHTTFIATQQSSFCTAIHSTYVSAITSPQ